MSRNRQFILLMFSIQLVKNCQGYCYSRWDVGWDTPDHDEPCNGVCRKQERYDNTYYTYLLKSDDGKSCTECIQDTNICPNCEVDEYWCSFNQSCKSLNHPCNLTCPSHIYPMLTGDKKACETCDDHFLPECDGKLTDPDTRAKVCMAWCPATNQCINISTDSGGSETCDGKCFKNSGYYEELRLCGKTNSCVRYDKPCGNECGNDYRYFCPKSNECQSKSLPCDGECPEGKRYCPRYKIDDFIGDGRGSCLDYDDPCGEDCPIGLQFCLANYGCVSQQSRCPCPYGKWPAKDCGPVQKCSLSANETLPLTVRRCSVLASIDGGKSTRVMGGDCHHKYAWCKETETCVPLLYSSCGYSDWLNAFQLQDCIQHTPLRLIRDCYKKAKFSDEE
eukprot:GFUD01020666.1.p1 GENE.GFUD01020666.1~~GFUD01020666.1.p1  ORF type:complete len:391 (-),score=28.89 GFUD01020666.1:802-1974(-)